MHTHSLMKSLFKNEKIYIGAYIWHIMESEKLLENLFDKKILVILRLLAKKKDQKFTLQEISNATKVPLASTFRILKRLLDLEIISMEHTKHLKIYSWIDTERTKFLENVLKGTKTIMDEFIDAMNKINGIKTIILHGKEEKDKANIIIIGDSIDNELIRQVVVNIKTKYLFTITHLVMSESQYIQMAAMNLFSGKKEVLLEK